MKKEVFYKSIDFKAIFYALLFGVICGFLSSMVVSAASLLHDGEQWAVIEPEQTLSFKENGNLYTVSTDFKDSSHYDSNSYMSEFLVENMSGSPYFWAMKRQFKKIYYNTTFYYSDKSLSACDGDKYTLVGTLAPWYPYTGNKVYTNVFNGLDSVSSSSSFGVLDPYITSYDCDFSVEKDEIYGTPYVRFACPVSGDTYKVPNYDDVVYDVSRLSISFDWDYDVHNALDHPDDPFLGLVHKGKDYSVHSDYNYVVCGKHVNLKGEEIGSTTPDVPDTPDTPDINVNVDMSETNKKLDTLNDSINKQTEQAQKNHDEFMNSDISDKDKEQPDDSAYKDYEDSENALLDKTKDVDMSSVDVGIDGNSSNFIWDTLTRLMKSHAKVFAMFIGVLSIGIIKLALGR